MDDLTYVSLARFFVVVVFVVMVDLILARGEVDGDGGGIKSGRLLDFKVGRSAKIERGKIKGGCCSEF